MDGKERLKSLTVNEIMKKYPTTIGVFNRFNIDSCCGGSEILDVAIRNARADMEAVIDALLKEIGRGEV